MTFFVVPYTEFANSETGNLLAKLDDEVTEIERGCTILLITKLLPAIPLHLSQISMLLVDFKHRKHSNPLLCLAA